MRLAQRTLSKAFAARAVNKRYIAVVAGRLQAPAEAWGVIDLPIVADWPNRPLRMIDHQFGKPSVTRWRVLEHDEIALTTRVELEPVTGRSHQLRLHLRELGYPILGDTLYAPPSIQAMAARLLLHAVALGFEHPVTGKGLLFESQVPF